MRNSTLTHVCHKLSLTAAWLALAGALLTAGQPQPAAAAPAAPATPLPLPVLIFAGQSNATGWITNVNDLTPAQRQPQPQVLFYGPNETGHTWGSLTPPTVLTNGVGSNVGFGPEISTGLVLTNLPDFGLVAEVKYAEVGTDLDYWWDPDTGPTYSRMQQRVAAAIAALQTAYPSRSVYVAGFFWMQGEADAVPSNNDILIPYAYDENLTHLIERVRQDYNDPLLPFVFGQIRGGHHYADLIRTAQANVARTVPGVAFIGTDDLPYEGSDGLHFTSAGIYTLGQRFGAAFAALAALPIKTYIPMGMR